MLVKLNFKNSNPMAKRGKRKGMHRRGSKMVHVSRGGIQL